MLIRLAAALALTSIVTATSWAEEPAVKVETLASDLQAPCAIAVQPQAGALFVVDAGAGRILRVNINSGENLGPVVTELPKVMTAKPAAPFGQIRLEFLNPRTLVVIALEDGRQVLRLFELPDDTKPLTWSDSKQRLDASVGRMDSVTGQFCGLAATPATLYLTQRDAKGGAIVKIDVNSDRTLGQPERLISLEGVAAALVSKGHLLVAAEGSKRGHSLTFTDARAGKQLMSLASGLLEVTALAYSPKSGQLYALDFAAGDPAKAGLYRLDSKTGDLRQAIEPVRIVKLDQPTALAFGPDGAAYVTVRSAKRGAVVKILGDL